MKSATTWIIAMALGASGVASAQILPAKSKGILTVDYTFTSEGKWTDAQHNDNRDWHVSRKVSLTAQMVAQSPSPVAALLPGDGGRKDMASRKARIESGNQKLQPMMGDIQKIMQKCGEDAACMQREASKMVGGMDMNAARAAGQDAAAAAGGMGSNYQIWQVSTYSGRYTADETYNNALADPDCLKAARAQCVSQTTRKGSGPAPVNDSPLAVMMEVDGPGKRLQVNLPIAAGNMPITRTVTGKVPDGKTGTFPDQMLFPWTRIQPVTVAIPDGLDKANGTQKVKIDGEFGEGGTLTISWRFTRAAQ